MPPSSESTRAHEQAAAEHAAAGGGVRCAVLTISDTRTRENDAGGDLIARLLEEAAMRITARAIVRDDPAAIRAVLESWLADESIDAILTTGGTGIAKRDTTVEVVRSLLAAELEGFGELFRMLSWKEVGAAAMMSRAVGGLAQRSSRGADRTPPAERAERSAGGALIFAMPGSVNAVETAMKNLIVPQLPHLVWERNR